MINASGYTAAIHIHDHYLARIVRKTYASYAYIADFYVFLFSFIFATKLSSKKKIEDPGGSRGEVQWQTNERTTHQR